MPELEKIKKEYEKVLEQLADPELSSDWQKFEQLNERKKLLEEIIEKTERLQETKNKVEENKAILKAQEDPELSSLAQEETALLMEEEKKLEKELKILLQSKDETQHGAHAENENKIKGAPAVIMEVRAGAGGEEAALFAADLFRMYSKYAGSQGWKQKILDSNRTELGGLKQIIFELKNARAFEALQYEGGVHRVQRIPGTEKKGRVHTSTASVAVLAKPKKAEVKLKPENIKIDFYRASGPGGQNVNKRETAVRITHIPSGIVVTSQAERNQLQNKENALTILQAKLLAAQQLQEVAKLQGKRKAQIGRAKRAEKVRTYNFPQDRITDHRVKKSWSNIEKIINGRLDPIIKALQKSSFNIL